MLNQDDTIRHGQDGFTLLRLVLVDSLSPGRIIQLPLDGGAVLTGRNGRGKTSLLQLLLLFYGESPNRIVTTEAGRETFVGYYLPRTTSYIVFEYQRHTGHKRMVVAYADKAGERVLYRFIRSGYEVTQFVQDNGEFVRVPDPDPETLALFKHRFTVEPDRRLAEVRVALEYDSDASTEPLNEDTEIGQGGESSEAITGFAMGVGVASV